MMTKENEGSKREIDDFINELRVSLQKNPATSKDLKSALLKFRKTQQNQGEEEGEEDLQQVLTSIIPPGLHCFPSSNNDDTCTSPFASPSSPHATKTGLDVLNFILGSSGEGIQIGQEDLTELSPPPPPPLEYITSDDDEFAICTKHTRKKDPSHPTLFRDNSVPQKNSFELLDTSPFEIDPEPSTLNKKSDRKRSKANKKNKKTLAEVKTFAYTTTQLVTIWSSMVFILASVAVSMWSGHMQQQQALLLPVNQTAIVKTTGVSIDENDCGSNATVDIAHPVTGSNLIDGNAKLIWNITGFPEYSRMAQCTVYMNDIVIYADILRLTNESVSTVTLNFESKQESGDYNATVAVIIPLRDGTERLLMSTSLYTVNDDEQHQRILKVKNPMNGTLLVESQPLVLEFTTPEVFKTRKEGLGMVVKFNAEEYAINDTSSTSITLSGMPLGKHTAGLYLLENQKILASELVEFQVLGWTELSKFSTAALRHYLNTFQLEEYERGLIESVLDARFEQHELL